MGIFKDFSPVQLSNGQIRTECPFRENHTDGSGRMSFFVSPNINAYHCFGGETRVPTDKGTFPIKELVGKKVRVLSQNGNFVEATFSCYGKNLLWELHLSREGFTKTIRTTQGHRWFLRRRKDAVLTENLRKGDYLEAALFSSSLEKEQSLRGIRHGIVFGDGTLDKSRSRIKALVNLHGAKMELARFFSPTENRGIKVRGGKEYIRIYNIHRGSSFKNLPALDSSLKYLRGFLAGYIATDGCISEEGILMLNSARYEDLEFCREAFFRLGINTSPIGVQYRKGFSDVLSPLYKITIRTNNLDEAFFIRKDQRDRFLSCTKKYQRTHWKVIGVFPTDYIEDVYCAEVPVYHSFTLEDDILTGNCFSCEAKGNLVKLLTTRFKVNYFYAMGLVHHGEHKPKPAAFDIDAVWDFNKPPKEFIKRGYSKETLRHFRVGMTEDDEIIIPYYSDFKHPINLLGYQKRWYYPDRRVLNSKHFNKKEYLYNLDLSYAYVVLVEGQSDVWRLYQHGYNACALMGANISSWQVEQLSKFDRVYLALDNDEAGRRGVEICYFFLKNHTDVRLIPYTTKDPGECASKDEWIEAFQGNTDYAVYSMEMAIGWDDYLDMRDEVLREIKGRRE